VAQAHQDRAADSLPDLPARHDLPLAQGPLGLEEKKAIAIFDAELKGTFANLLSLTLSPETVAKEALAWSGVLGFLPDLSDPAASVMPEPLRSKPDIRVWTDDFSNLLQALKR